MARGARASFDAHALCASLEDGHFVAEMVLPCSRVKILWAGHVLLRMLVAAFVEEGSRASWLVGSWGGNAAQRRRNVLLQQTCGQQSRRKEGQKVEHCSSGEANGRRVQSTATLTR